MVNIEEKSMAESWNGCDSQALLMSGHWWNREGRGRADFSLGIDRILPVYIVPPFSMSHLDSLVSPSITHCDSCRSLKGTKARVGAQPDSLVFTLRPTGIFSFPQ